MKSLIQKSVESFEEKFPEIECSAHERTSSARCICEELPDINEENRNFKFHLISSQQALIGEIIKWAEEEKSKINPAWHASEVKERTLNDLIAKLKEDTPSK